MFILLSKKVNKYKYIVLLSFKGLKTIKLSWADAKKLRQQENEKTSFKNFSHIIIVCSWC
jgi:hypothetical protein